MQDKLVVIVPSRSRPQNARRLWGAFIDTNAAADLLVVTDDDDPTVGEYPQEVTIVGPRRRLGPTLNDEATRLAHDYRYIGFMGDDHLPRTECWDRWICDALNDLGTGIVYGDDKLQGVRLPTAAFMTSDIVSTLGYFCPPGLVHMFCDDAWSAWGRGADCIRYLPNVVIEHMHPGNGKGAYDALYVETSRYMQTDSPKWDEYRTTTLQNDVDKIRALRA